MNKRNLGIFTFVCISITLLVSIIGCAQQQSVSDIVSPPSTVTSITVGNSGVTAAANSKSITLYPTVVDQTNAVITNLKSGNFTITIQVSGSATATQSCTVSTVTNQSGTAGERISLGMSLDRSGSMAGSALTDLMTAAATFIDLMNTADELGVVSFDSTVTVGVTLAATTATNKTTMKNYVNALTAGSLTALYESMATAVDQAVLGTKTRKAVIAMTDGGENASAATYDTTTEVINYAKSKNIPIYTVGLGTYISSAELVAISNATGGIYYAAPTSATLNTLYTAISSALSSSYTVSVSSPITLTSGYTYIITLTIRNYGVITGSTTFYLTI